MTADPSLIHRVLVDVVIHVSEIVCLDPGWTMPGSSPRAPARPTSRSYRRCAYLTPPACAHPDNVEPGL
jgi:hypothetical protein